MEPLRRSTYDKVQGIEKEHGVIERSRGEVSMKQVSGQVAILSSFLGLAILIAFTPAALAHEGRHAHGLACQIRSIAGNPFGIDAQGNVVYLGGWGRAGCGRVAMTAIAPLLRESGNLLGIELRPPHDHPGRSEPLWAPPTLH